MAELAYFEISKELVSLLSTSSFGLQHFWAEFDIAHVDGDTKAHVSLD